MSFGNRSGASKGENDQNNQQYRSNRGDSTGSSSQGQTRQQQQQHRYPTQQGSGSSQIAALVRDDSSSGIARRDRIDSIAGGSVEGLHNLYQPTFPYGTSTCSSSSGGFGDGASAPSIVSAGRRSSANGSDMGGYLNSLPQQHQLIQQDNTNRQMLSPELFQQEQPFLRQFPIQSVTAENQQHHHAFQYHHNPHIPPPAVSSSGGSVMQLSLGGGSGRYASGVPPGFDALPRFQEATSEMSITHTSSMRSASSFHHRPHLQRGGTDSSAGSMISSVTQSSIAPSSTLTSISMLSASAPTFSMPPMLDSTQEEIDLSQHKGAPNNSNKFGNSNNDAYLSNLFAKPNGVGMTGAVSTMQQQQHQQVTQTTTTSVSSPIAPRSGPLYNRGSGGSSSVVGGPTITQTSPSSSLQLHHQHSSSSQNLLKAQHKRGSSFGSTQSRNTLATTVSDRSGSNNISMQGQYFEVEEDDFYLEEESDLRSTNSLEEKIDQEMNDFVKLGISSNHNDNPNVGGNVGNSVRLGRYHPSRYDSSSDTGSSVVGGSTIRSMSNQSYGHGQYNQSRNNSNNRSKTLPQSNPSQAASAAVAALPTSGRITNNYAGTSASINAMIENQPISYQPIASAASMANVAGIGIIPPPLPPSDSNMKSNIPQSFSDSVPAGFLSPIHLRKNNNNAALPQRQHWQQSMDSNSMANYNIPEGDSLNMDNNSRNNISLFHHQPRPPSRTSNESFGSGNNTSTNVALLASKSDYLSSAPGTDFFSHTQLDAISSNVTDNSIHSSQNSTSSSDFVGAPILPQARTHEGPSLSLSTPGSFSDPYGTTAIVADDSGSMIDQHADLSYDHSLGGGSLHPCSDGNSDHRSIASTTSGTGPISVTPLAKKREWLQRMNTRLLNTPIGQVDPNIIPITAVMNAWAKTKSSKGADMVEMWLERVQKESAAGNPWGVEPTTKMYTMAVDAWAKSGEKGAATHAEKILQHMNKLYQSGHNPNLKPTTGIFNAVINSWARSGEPMAPTRAEQILDWMDQLHRTGQTGNLDIKPDKYSYNTVIHAWAKSGGRQAAMKAQGLLNSMHLMYRQGNTSAKPDTITYNVVINAWAKSGGEGSAVEAERLLSDMHRLYDSGNADVKPNVVTYGAVIDAWAKSGEKGAAARADNILANMIRLHQSDPIRNHDLRPNTYVFNTVINAWAKSKQSDAASKAEEMLVAMGRLHACGIPGLKPDAFTYTAVIDAWAKSGYRGAATRADQLLEKMETKYIEGDNDLKPNTFTYNAVINALAKSGDQGAAARAERVLQNMVRRHRDGNDDVKPTTINFNTVLDAWAKSGGKGAAARAEEILVWMDQLNKSGNTDVKPDTITFNAVIDAWARSGEKRAPRRAEEILDHMDTLYRSGNEDVKPDTYTYNTVINAYAKSGEKGSASRAEQILASMEQRARDGDEDLKPNTRTHTSVIDAWAKSGERGAAARAEHILKSMQTQYNGGNSLVKPNAHTFNAVMNSCAFTKIDEDRAEALKIAFRVFDWLMSRSDMHPDAYTFTIMLSVCANLLPKDDQQRRFSHAQSLFEKCCQAGHVNDFVLRKLRQTVLEREYVHLVGSSGQNSEDLPNQWTRYAAKSGRNRAWVNRGGRGRR